MNSQGMVSGSTAPKAMVDRMLKLTLVCLAAIVCLIAAVVFGLVMEYCAYRWWQLKVEQIWLHPPIERLHPPVKHKPPTNPRPRIPNPHHTVLTFRGGDHDR